MGRNGLPIPSAPPSRALAWVPRMLSALRLTGELSKGSNGNGLVSGVIACAVADRSRRTSRLLGRRATRVPYRRVNHGTERATTVAAIRLLTWRLPL